MSQAGIMGPHFREVADVTDMVAGAVLIHVFPIHFSAAASRRALKGLQNGDAVGAAAADVIDFATAGLLRKGMDETGHVQGMDVVADLFAFVTKDFVEAALDVALDRGN